MATPALGFQPNSSVRPKAAIGGRHANFTATRNFNEIDAFILVENTCAGYAQQQVALSARVSVHSAITAIGMPAASLISCTHEKESFIATMRILACSSGSLLCSSLCNIS